MRGTIRFGCRAPIWMYACVPTICFSDGACRSNHGEFSTMPGQGQAPLVDPERDGQATGGVGARDDVVVAVAFGDPPPRRVELGEVVAEVGDVVRRLVRTERAAVLPQVEGVEVVAAVGPPLGVAGLEEVVRESVHVQHGPPACCALAVRGPPDQGRHHRAFVVWREPDRLGGVRRPEDVGHRLHARSLPADLLSACTDPETARHRLRVIVRCPTAPPGPSGSRSSGRQTPPAACTPSPVPAGSRHRTCKCPGRSRCRCRVHCRRPRG